MKHSTFWTLSLFALLLLYACERDDYDDNEIPDSHLILEARNYFEDYASMEMEEEPTGLHPGNIAPEWGRARAFTQLVPLQ
ncbi:hypothetical protein [Bacteroides sp. 519]|uniref:hypothetical protein n=1 Tax=Bacteroides sp. 519 TaxID=2302937 RepID=UPI0013D2041A|nr:hypothetical protein [Bacteroides sp. 519]NDV60052.1 hypothetical protein [Bacteroides sp. 519]